jgi:hypothetical protein
MRRMPDIEFDQDAGARTFRTAVLAGYAGRARGFTPASVMAVVVDGVGPQEC